MYILTRWMSGRWLPIASSRIMSFKVNRLDSNQFELVNFFMSSVNILIETETKHLPYMFRNIYEKVMSIDGRWFIGDDFLNLKENEYLFISEAQNEPPHMHLLKITWNIYCSLHKFYKLSNTSNTVHCQNENQKYSRKYLFSNGRHIPRSD